MLALIKSKNFTPGTPPLKFLQANLPQALMPLLKSLTIGNICEIARFLLDNMPSKIPKLIISPNINNYAAVSYTQRSYLNTHMNKSYIRNSTPTIKKTKEIPEIIYWVQSLGYQGDFVSDARSGTLFCILVNLIEKKQAIKGFFNPAKTMSAVKSNFFKVFEYLKKDLQIESSYFNEREICSGNEKFILGLIEDIKRFYQFKDNNSNNNRENYSAFGQYSKDKIANWLKSLKMPSPETIESRDIGKYLLNIISKSYKIFIEEIQDNNPRYHLLKFFSELLKIDPELSLKYSNRINVLLSDKNLLINLLEDIMKKEGKVPQNISVDSLVKWLDSLDILQGEKTLSELIPRARTGKLLWEIADKLLDIQFIPYESLNTIQSLENITRALDCLFNHGLISYDLKNSAHNIFQGDISTLISLLKSIYYLKNNCSYNEQANPREYKSPIPIYRSVTPPPCIYS